MFLSISRFSYSSKKVFLKEKEEYHFCSDTATSTQLGGEGEGGGGLPCPFLKIKKNCPDFKKKKTDCGIPWVKFPFEM